MQKSLKSPEYARLIAMLVAVRKKANIRQQALARKLGKPQSFVAKYEGGERRIDLIEFITIVRALNGDPLNSSARLSRVKTRPKWRVKVWRDSPSPGRYGLCSILENFVIQLARSEPQDCSGLARLFRRAERHCPPKGRDSMDRATTEKAIAVILTEIHSRLKGAARIAKAAEACAGVGSIAEGVEVSMEIEQILYEAGRLQDAASLLNRLSR
jgi:transcriptional regulator with XRE-family HTH domain